MKKLLGLAACALMACTMMVPAHAASGINGYEKELIDAMKGDFLTDERLDNGLDQFRTEANLSTLTEWLNRDDVDLTSEQVGSLEWIVYNSANIAANANAKNISELNAEDAKRIVAYANYQFQVNDIDLSVSFDFTSKVVTVKDGAGNVVFTTATASEEVIKDTGTNFASSAVTFGGLGLALVGAALTIRKREEA